MSYTQVVKRLGKHLEKSEPIGYVVTRSKAIPGGHMSSKEEVVVQGPSDLTSGENQDLMSNISSLLGRSDVHNITKLIPPDIETMAPHEQIPTPERRWGFIEGQSPGQKDDVPAMLSEGEYVIPADVVADIGNGNSKAGAERLDEFMRNIRLSKQHGAKLPPKTKKLATYFT